MIKLVDENFTAPEVITTEKMDKLVEELNERAEDMTEYYTSNSDNMYAEFAESFGYGEACTSDILDEIRHQFRYNDNLDEVMEKLETLDSQNILELLEAHCELNCAANLRTLHGEIYSVAMDEIEDDVEALLTAHNWQDYSPEQKDYVAKNIDYYLYHNEIYINLDYNRWALILDFDSLRESLKAEVA